MEMTLRLAASLFTVLLAASPASADADLSPGAEACKGAPDLYELVRTKGAGKAMATLGDGAGHAKAVACVATAARLDGWGGLTAAYLARSELALHDPLWAALGINVYARLVAPPENQEWDTRLAREALTPLVAGYERAVTAAEMKAAVARVVEPALAEKLALGVDAGLAAARAAGPEAAVWKRHAAFVEALAPLRPAIDALRAELATGAPGDLLARIDQARNELLAAGKSRGEVVKSAGFRSLSWMARVVAAKHGQRRPFELAMPPPFFPTREHLDEARPKEPKIRIDLDQGWFAARSDALGGEWSPQTEAGRGLKTFVLPIKAVKQNDDGTTTLTLQIRGKVSYAGGCRVELVFIDAEGQGWGRDKCSAGSTETIEEGPPSVTVATAGLVAAKPGHVVELVAREDGADAHVVRVWDKKQKRILSIGPFAL